MEFGDVLHYVPCNVANALHTADNNNNRMTCTCTTYVVRVSTHQNIIHT